MDYCKTSHAYVNDCNSKLMVFNKKHGPCQDLKITMNNCKVENRLSFNTDEQIEFIDSKINNFLIDMNSGTTFATHCGTKSLAIHNCEFKDVVIVHDICYPKIHINKLDSSSCDKLTLNLQ